MNAATVSLNVPQSRFIAMPHKFKAFVAGYGCMRDSSLVVTAQGAIPIADIDGSVPLLSWSETSNQFELAPSTASYPKGKANLYRVITTRGEFVASGFHRVFCADYKYRLVQSLCVGQALFSSLQSQLSTKPDVAPLSLSLSAQSFSKRDEGYLGRYVSVDHPCGQPFLLDQDTAQECFPLLADVQGFAQSLSHVDAPKAQALEHNRLCQLSSHAYRKGLQHLFGHPVARAAGCIASLPIERISGYIRSRLFRQHLLNSAYHHTGLLSDPNHADNTQEPAFDTSTLYSCSTTETIISIERLQRQEWYWDLSVLDNHNYITVDGTVHHNSGKTWVGCNSLAKHFMEFPRINAGYFGATYSQIRDIFYPTIDEALYPWGFLCKIKEGNKEVELYQGRKYYGTVICRSMERPETIIGFKIGKTLVDEIDVLKQVKAQVAWRKIIARMRFVADGLQNGIDVTTTPEGFKFVYRQFVEQVREKPETAGMYGLIQASTYDNEKNLPDDYIPSLLASYPAQLIDAYINGQFVNLQTGSVYVAYDRQKNACTDTIQPQEALFIGMDFNVGKMAAITHVKREGLPRAVDEITGAYDTPDMIRRLKERYWGYNGNSYNQTCAIRVYPDASGDSRKSVNATETDIALLKEAGFTVVVNKSNPPVKDRINSMNGMFCNANGERRYLVNPVTCPTYAASLEQQAWAENGEPDKTTGHDHTNDAGGYFIVKDYPIVKKTAQTQNMW